MSENAIKSSVVIKVIAHIFLPLALFSVLSISWGNSWEHFLLNFSYFATSIFVLLYLWIFLVINQSYRTLSCPSSWWLKLLSYWRNKSTGSWIKSTLWQKRSLPLKRHSFKKNESLSKQQHITKGFAKFVSNTSEQQNTHLYAGRSSVWGKDSGFDFLELQLWRFIYCRFDGITLHPIVASRKNHQLLWKPWLYAEETHVTLGW